MTTSPDALLIAVTDMTGEIAGLRCDTRDLQTETAELRRYGKRNRHLIRLVAASVALDILLSAGLAYAIHRADQAANTARRAASAQVVTCRSSNAARTVQTDLWNFILNTFPPPAGETATAKTQRETSTAQFKTYVASAFAQRNCDQLLNGGKP